MKRVFLVAGLSFSLELPDTHPVADRLSNYDPFESNPAMDPASFLFSLTVVSEPPATDGEVLYQAPEKEGVPVLNLKRTEEGFLAEFASMPGVPFSGLLSFGRDFRHGSLYTCGSPASQTFAVNNSLMLMYTFASASRSALEIHASVVVHGGRGFLFLGRSGTGKSTHSSLWLKHIEGTCLLNDDNPVLRIVDGKVHVFGTPWSGKTPCYKAEDALVGAIVRIRQAPENAIERLDTVQAYTSVLSSISGFRPFREVTDAQHVTLAAIATEIPCYLLRCLPDEAAARLCHSTVDG